MGINSNFAKFIISVSGLRAPIGKVLTLGRQQLRADRGDIERYIAEYNRTDVDWASFDSSEKYAESLFKLIGSTQVSSMDASPYEGASIIHDLNYPVPENLYAQFDLVIDGGTLEHVFNYPESLKSAMKMTKVGGRIIIATPASNFMGHGFYCFSPELFYRVFSSCNGFAVERMVISSNHRGSQWYEVLDPKVIRRRVELTTNHQQMLLYVCARRLEEKVIFASYPQQSDYAAMWESSKDDGTAAPGTATLAPVIPEEGGLKRLALYRLLRAIWHRMSRSPSVAPDLSEKARIRNAQLLSIEAQSDAYRLVDR